MKMYVASRKGVVHSTTAGWTRSTCWSNVIEQPCANLNLEDKTGEITRRRLRNILYKRGWRVHEAHMTLVAV